MPTNAEVYAWMVNLVIGSDDAKYREQKQSVFITDGIDLGQPSSKCSINMALVSTGSAASGAVVRPA